MTNGLILDGLSKSKGGGSFGSRKGKTKSSKDASLAALVAKNTREIKPCSSASESLLRRLRIKRRTGKKYVTRDTSVAILAIASIDFPPTALQPSSHVRVVWDSLEGQDRG